MNLIDVRVHAIRMEAETIHSFELRSPTGSALPPFTAGAHIEVHMDGHLARSYSIANDPAQTDRYVIAVNKEAAGRGGSRFMHANIRVGQTLRVEAPRNNFELFEQAPHSVFIAGGIGVTPMLSMIARMQRLGKPWTLHYGGRERRLMAFLDELMGMKQLGADVRLHVDAEAGGRVLDMVSVVRDCPPGSHLYCCGPKPMLAAFEDATQALPQERVHVEYFSAKEEAAADGGFVVQLARSGRTLPVAAGKTILDTILDAGVQADFSCMEGVCGSCEVKVLDGVPDHRDSVLSNKERAANDRMMVCCSGSRSQRLVLDL